MLGMPIYYVVIASDIIGNNSLSIANGQLVDPEVNSIRPEGGVPRKKITLPQELEKVIKLLHRRWFVLTNNLILTYKERRVYESPT
jgi:hypothetical protein